MATIQDIFREHGPAYLQAHGDHIPQNHRKVIEAIISCRSSACGITVYECTGCGKSHHIFRSCGNRHCPTCQNQKSLDWMDRQLGKQLPVPHFMVTFTVPEEIRRFFRSNQSICYDSLFKASSESMKKLAADDRHIGGDLPGFLGVLHTWGRTQIYNPHVHYVVPGGAWSKADAGWHPSRPDFFLPNKALSRICRAKFRDLMKAAGLYDRIDPVVWRKGWNVNIQPVGESGRSIRYLSHYVFKVAISDHRIISAEGGRVTFSYRKPKSRRSRKMTLDAFEFMRRFLQHVLPTGFQKVRYYGFMHGCSKATLEKVRASIEMMHGFDPDDENQPVPERKKALPTCPDCGHDLKYICSVLPHQMPHYRGPD